MPISSLWMSPLLKLRHNRSQMPWQVQHKLIKQTQMLTPPLLRRCKRQKTQSLQQLKLTQMWLLHKPPLMQIQAKSPN